MPRMTVKIRRDHGEVKPEAEQLDGRTFIFRFGWTLEDDHSRYPNETAWLADDPSWPSDAPCWIASGDLVTPNEQRQPPGGAQQ